MPRLNPFAGGRTKLTKLWESTIDGHVVSLAWSDALGLIAAASADGPIALFDAKTGRLICNLFGHGFGTAHIAWSVDGLHLASAGQDGKVRVWDGMAVMQIHELSGGAAWVERVAWCPTANLLASAAGKKLRLWNLDGEMLREYPDHPSTITDIQWKPNDALLASTAYGKLFLWRPEEQIAVREFAWQGSILALAWSPNGEYLAAGTQDSSVHFWVMKTGEDLHMQGYLTKVRELAWDPTSRYLATGGAEVCTVWDCSGAGPAGSEPIQLEAHKETITFLAYQRQGTLLASGGEDGLVALWQPGKQLGALALAKHDAPISQLAWSADDQRLAVGTADGNVLLYAR
ncbi:MAG: WD40 repeat domain-containing protein [Gemmataceae bacterium]|nr:WD40 repeat domain-containing protein [Gemmataceae bacterium]